MRGCCSVFASISAAMRSRPPVLGYRGHHDAARSEQGERSLKRGATNRVEDDVEEAFVRFE